MGSVWDRRSDALIELRVLWGQPLPGTIIKLIGHRSQPCHAFCWELGEQFIDIISPTLSGLLHLRGHALCEAAVARMLVLQPRTMHRRRMPPQISDADDAAGRCRCL